MSPCSKREGPQAERAFEQSTQKVAKRASPPARVTGRMKGRIAPEQRWYHEAGFVL